MSKRGKKARTVRMTGTETEALKTEPVILTCAYCHQQIPQQKVRHRPKFCSRTCWQNAINPPHFCEGCQKRLTAKQRRFCSWQCRRQVLSVQGMVNCQNCGEPIAKLYRYRQAFYCSRTCSLADRAKQGFYQRFSTAGNLAQANFKMEHGTVPGYERRSRIVAELNRTSPRRRKEKKEESKP